MARWSLSAEAVALADGSIAPRTLAIEGGRIVAVRPGAGAADVELGGGVLAPGFVDLQVNGCFGWDFAGDGADGVRAAAARLPERGVTAFLPTFITAPIAALAASIEAVAPLVDDGAPPPAGVSPAAGVSPPAGAPAPRSPSAPSPSPSARVLGVHVEGPFISPERKGAHPPAHIVAPDPASVARLASPAVRLVTLAPELPGGLDAIRAFRRSGAVVSIGHSDATAAEADAAADAGATVVTHLYNGQRGLHHREPGVVGAALTDDRFTAGLIADLEHVAPVAILLAFRAARGRIALVSDAISAAGMPAGRYALSGRSVTVPEHGAPRHEEGGLSGAVATLDRAVANVAGLGIPIGEAIAAATAVPARAIGATRLGRIEPGAAADLVWLGDDLRPRRTWIGGAVAWQE